LHALRQATGSRLQQSKINNNNFKSQTEKMQINENSNQLG